MAIEQDNATSNRTARLLLDDGENFPRDNGQHAGMVIMPDYPVPEELVDYVVGVEHKLNLNDLRAQDALAKMVRFDQGSVASFTIREHGIKTMVDARKIERDPDTVARYGAELRRDIEDVKEYRIAQLATTPANYPNSNKDTGLDVSAATIRADFNARRAAIRAGGFDVTDWLMGEDTFAGLADNNIIHDFAGSDRLVDEAVIKAFFRIPGQVVVANYSRILGDDTAATQFWPNDFSLLVSNRRTLSTRTYGLTGIMTYGAPFGRAGAVLTDVRNAVTDPIEQISQVGAFQRYTEALMNPLLGFLDTDVTGF